MVPLNSLSAEEEITIACVAGNKHETRAGKRNSVLHDQSSFRECRRPASQGRRETESSTQKEFCSSRFGEIKSR